MTRFLLAAVLALLPLAARAQTEQQILVDRATLTVQEMLAGSPQSDARNLLRRATGAMICPRVFKAGFIFGGQGGSCVLVGRTQAGWTYPAFYGLGSGSFGLQIGIQDAQLLIIVLTQKGLQALLDSQFKFGADAGVAVATVGAGVQGSTTAALKADIVAFSMARGLYAGITLDGSLISARSEWNSIYYGRPIAAQQIVLQGDGNNPGAEPLREMLARFSGG
ncbi:Lipid-binding SYLF domain-containing protein [Rhodovastum atsumiense]|uniref:Lipid-binding SYLF domain-containing protein n=1 Tax=Rhodovastum atsumiense TaxID=504468 RepID=A0A5M6IVS3_9PROT|nr:lipid-binding SYLF domain-containing protein [Rhodovastum atsumiense]KAA5611515.1 lipid-binding SYLF domain-containing protein [Rhodovastum atsumiense]CAH2601215.1 Lipid-binding SYLF domain-containing protein [Rhodovastum atsumiense]